MSKQAGTPIEYFPIRAETIVPLELGEMVSLILFNVEKETKDRLLDISSGVNIGPVQLITKTEDGSWDDVPLENQRNHYFVSFADKGFGANSAFVLTLFRR